eukprot:1150687-Pelagomonas_calceolata.AAC.5
MQAHADTVLPARKLGWGATQPILPLGQVPGPTAGIWAPTLYRRGGEEMAAMAAAELPGRTIAHLVLSLGTAHDEKRCLTVSSMRLHSGARLIAKYKLTLCKALKK